MIFCNVFCSPIFHEDHARERTTVNLKAEVVIVTNLVTTFSLSGINVCFQ